MLIHRFILSLLLGSSVASTLLAQVDESPKDAFIQALPTLERLLKGGQTDFYTPTPLISPALRDALAEAPSQSALLLDYYRAGGGNANQTPNVLFFSRLLADAGRSSKQRISQLRASRLQITAPTSLSLFPEAQPWDRASQLAPGGDFYQSQQRYAISTQLGSSLGLVTEREKRRETPVTLALAQPAGGATERALQHYTQETKMTPIALPTDREGSSLLRQRHWIPSLESAIQFSQNQISDNWYKGGASNLNVYMRNYFALRYITERVQWTNEIESRLSVYNADRDSLHRYRVADDLLRLRSNYGIRAWSKIFYSLDAELRTQLFQSFQENKTSLQSDLFAPYTINVGLGMKYEHSMKSSKVYGRAFLISVNVAPISYTFRATTRAQIDLARHGLAPDKLWYQRIGSTIRANWQWKVNLNLTWSSRLYFNTSYESVEAEWENTLDMAITRYFSTRFNLNLRFDDGVRPAPGWNRYLQYNELLSFGFSYRL